MNFLRGIYAVFAVLLLLVLIREGVIYGGSAAVVALFFLLLPDVALIGAFAEQGKLKRTSVPFYNLLHRFWFPVSLLFAGVGVVLLFPSVPELLGLGLDRFLFLASLAWFLHIFTDRAFGFGLRKEDGTIIPVSLRKPVKG